MSERTVKISSFAPGVNNRLEPTQLEVTLADRSKATFLYAGDNVDIDEKGNVKRRRGQTTALSGDAHSLWGDDLGAYAVLDGVLVSLARAGAGLTPTAVRAGMPKLPVSFSRGADGDAYWSNGVEMRRVADGADRPAATASPQPAGPNDIVASVGGGLAAGQYLLAFTNISVDGESAATPVVAIDVPANGMILLTGQRHVYMSAPDGDVLTYQGFEDRVFTHNEGGRRCATLNTAPMPPGSIVRHYNGCLLVAAGSLMYVSLPYSYGLLNPSKGYIPFPAPITVIEPTTNGVYICADKTYWITDVMGEGVLQTVLPYGGIPNTSGQSPKGTNVFWQSPRGLVIGDSNMAVKAVQEEALSLSGAVSGASLFRERDGSAHIVSSRAAAAPNSAAASSFMEAEVVRASTVL